jgi:nitrogenase-associated protein
MATIVFYEKPGCTGNAQQKQLLTTAGHTVVARNILTEPWTAERLRTFFADRPVADWFNRNAPRVKSGEVTPESFGADAALALLVAEPLLIRRPLMEIDARRLAGFDPDTVHREIGLGKEWEDRRVRGGTTDMESCRRPDLEAGCPAPGDLR